MTTKITIDSPSRYQLVSSFYIRGEFEVPLVVHRFSEKARREMVERQTKKAQKEGKEVRDLISEADTARYKMPGEVFDGFPAVGLKAAMVSAARAVDGMSMKEARQSFFLPGLQIETEGTVPGTVTRESLLPIVSPPYRVLESVVRVGQGTSMVRVRPAYEPWVMRVDVHHPQDVVSQETLALLLTIAGAQVGIGEHRPERNGENGRFKQISQSEYEDFRAYAQSAHETLSEEVA